jgi:serine/threonine-protein kinase
MLAGRYRVEEHLGTGGMGDVYRVHDEQLGEDVALKLVSFEDEKAAARFRREVKLARRITHSNVARTHDIGEHGGRSFLTMEYIAGHTLAEELDRTAPLPADDAVRISLAVARGLSAAHAADVIHRDLKPGNVMIEKGGRVVITDFGVARSLVEDRTVEGSQVLGTPYYMAPEQVLGTEVTPASDVYALGLLFYEMLTGELPFVGETPMVAVLARCRETPRDPRRLASIPDPLAELVLACLRMTPQGRPDLPALIRNLAAWADAAGGRTVASHELAGKITPSSLPSISSPFAPISLGQRCLAVLPFSYRGAPDHDFLGDTLAQELIDVLSRMRGTKVLAFGATSAHREHRDPRTVGRELGAETIVGGDVVAAGDQVRISVRLLEVDSGTQLWSHRFTTELGDVFRMQEIASQQIAEALRLELDVVGEQWRVSSETTNLYLRGRRALESRTLKGAEGAVELFEKCLERERFAPAIAGHAMAAIQGWWASLEMGSDRDWASMSEQSVARAMAEAPELAESHFAAGALAAQTAKMGEAVRHLADALAIAPAFVEAQRYLGELQIEAGRMDEGLRRLHLVLELDPSRTAACIGLSRVAALRGDYGKALRYVDAFEGKERGLKVAGLIARIRYGSWAGDEAAMKAAVAKAGEAEGPAMGFIAQFGKYLAGEGDVGVIDAAVAFAESFRNPRMVSMVGQLAVEALASRGETERALDLLERISNEALVDVAWLKECLALASLRGDPRFAESLARVRARAEALWQL